MKKYYRLGLIIILVLVLALSGCGGSSKGGGTSYTAGQSVTYTVGSVTFNMNYVPGGLTFLTDSGANAFDDAVTATVANAYWIAATEVTYELWSAVYTWATDTTATDGVIGHGQYSFAKSGAEGSDSSSVQEPVTAINWRDAMAWCNALTEYYNTKSGKSYACVYCTNTTYATPIRTSTSGSVDTTEGQPDNPCINSAAKGFRLPTSNEWELAARYIKDSNGDGDICDDGEYYPSNYASGADAEYNVTATGDYDGDGDTKSTGDVAVYGAVSTATVESKKPNKLGLYDMSGNAWEWCFDWYSSGSTRVWRGGGWNMVAGSMQLGIVNYTAPNYTAYVLGLRPVRTN